MFIVLCQGSLRTAQLGDFWEPLPILSVTSFPGPGSRFSEVSQFIYLTRHNYNNKYFVERSFLRPIRIKIDNDTMCKCVGMGVTPIFLATTVYIYIYNYICYIECGQLWDVYITWQFHGMYTVIYAPYCWWH